MKTRYRLFRRRGTVFYCFDNQTRLYTSLQTKDRKAAQQLVHAKNEAEAHPALCRQLGKVYLASSDPRITTRTWQDALVVITDTKSGPTRARWERAAREAALSPLKPMVLIETQAEDILAALKAGTVSTNVHLRKLHNFALDMSWIPWPIIPKRQWPKIQFRKKRGITPNEHQAVVRGESNPERKAYYELAWHLGAAQSDLAALTAQNIDWDQHLIHFHRLKTKAPCVLRFGETVAEILTTLPKEGLLFPAFHALGCNHRATEFRRACRRVGVKGVSLHCYRYAWAERAKSCGYPERFAQVALGHNCRAVHEAYASGAVPVLPALDEYEQTFRDRVIPLHARSASG